MTMTGMITIKSVMILLLLSVMIFVNLGKCQGHRILGIFPMNAKSHMAMFEQVMKGLVRSGHQVDVVSVFPLRTPYPNYTDLEIPAAMPKLVNNMTHEFLNEMLQLNIVHFLAVHYGNFICEKGFEQEPLRKILQQPPNNPPYDLVITEVSFLSS